MILHIFSFVKTSVNAKNVRKAMKEGASRLGNGKGVLFGKGNKSGKKDRQSEILAKNDLSWTPRENSSEQRASEEGEESTSNVAPLATIEMNASESLVVASLKRELAEKTRRLEIAERVAQLASLTGRASIQGATIATSAATSTGATTKGRSAKAQTGDWDAPEANTVNAAADDSSLPSTDVKKMKRDQLQTRGEVSVEDKAATTLKANAVVIKEMKERKKRKVSRRSKKKKAISAVEAGDEGNDNHTTVVYEPVTVTDNANATSGRSGGQAMSIDSVVPGTPLLTKKRKEKKEKMQPTSPLAYMRTDDGSTAVDDAAIRGMLAARGKAKSVKDYATADAIRDRLDAMGIEVNDKARQWKVKDGLRAKPAPIEGFLKSVPHTDSIISVAREMVPGTVFIRGVPENTSRHMLVSALEPFGNVTGARLVFDKETRMPNGNAYVDFADTTGVRKACAASKEALKNKSVDGGKGVWCQGVSLVVVPALTHSGVHAIVAGKTTRSKGKRKRGIDEIRGEERRKAGGGSGGKGHAQGRRGLVLGSRDRGGPNVNNK